MTLTNAILLLGPTGSGKTPLGELLERRGLPGRRCAHFDFGANLRLAVAADTPPAGLTDDDVALVADVLESGALLGDEHFHIAGKILRSFLAERDIAPDELIVLNGLPRHAGQARDVADIVDVTAVIDLRCTPQAVFERIRTNAGGDRVARADDDPAAVAAKLQAYAARIEPLLAHYRAAGARIASVDVHADTTAEQVWNLLNDSV